MSDNCPVCETVLNGKTPTQNSAFSTYAYDCPRCGKFVFKFRERDLEWTLNHSHDNDERFILSHNIRKMQKDDSEVVLDGNLVEKILKGVLPTPVEQKDILIQWIGDNMKAGGDYVRVNAYSIPAIIGARTEKEFYFIFEHLKTKGVVKNKTVVGGGNSALMDVTLTYSGLEYYEKLKREDAICQGVYDSNSRKGDDDFRDDDWIKNFEKLKNMMPRLLEEMRNDFISKGGGLIREFVVLPNKRVVFNGSKTRFAYFSEEHEHLQNKIDILENYGYVTDVAVGNTPIYRISEEFFEHLREQITGVNENDYDSRNPIDPKKQKAGPKDKRDLAETGQESLQEIIEVLKNWQKSKKTDQDFEAAKSALPPIAKTYDILCRNRDQCGAKTTDVIKWLGSAANDGSGYYPALLNELASPKVIADLEKWQEKPAKIGQIFYSRSQSIQELIAKGENHTLEFKETVQYNLETKQVDKDVRHDALKTIAGFLNADGGTLLIGISDSGKVKGIAIDKKAMNRANNDKFELVIRNHILSKDSKFMPQPIGRIKIDFEDIQGLTVCAISVQPLPKSEISHFEGSVYVRDGNQTLKLTGRDLTDWIKQRR